MPQRLKDLLDVARNFVLAMFSASLISIVINEGIATGWQLTETTKQLAEGIALVIVLLVYGAIAPSADHDDDEPLP